MCFRRTHYFDLVSACRDRTVCGRARLQIEAIGAVAGGSLILLPGQQALSGQRRPVAAGQTQTNAGNRIPGGAVIDDTACRHWKIQRTGGPAAYGNRLPAPDHVAARMVEDDAVFSGGHLLELVEALAIGGLPVDGDIERAKQAHSPPQPAPLEQMLLAVGVVVGEDNAGNRTGRFGGSGVIVGYAHPSRELALVEYIARAGDDACREAAIDLVVIVVGGGNIKLGDTSRPDDHGSRARLADAGEYAFLSDPDIDRDSVRWRRLRAEYETGRSTFADGSTTRNAHYRGGF
ncbi:MAG: hypothetical protein F4Y22_02645 [Gammaproteobacteria bacterium]|nr:hypothetical protein [Gammaproteobacteria bacterium]MYH46263.1 hypothetical protein [Gammaproteobacteria bacterium]MYL13878.1 hypothetical protein [Gammaproteobacteria bacterium]